MRERIEHEKLSYPDLPHVPEVGDTVVWHDPVGTPHNALVTSVHSAACINVVVVSSDGTKTDNYGRQIERHTSISHKSQNKIYGFYWRFPFESANPPHTALQT